MNLEKELEKVGLFEGVSQEVLARLAAVARERTLVNGEVLFREGDVGDEAFVIVMGTLKLEKTSQTGDREELSMLGSGSYIGEVALVTPSHTHTFTATAMEKSFVVGFHQSDIDALSEKHPEGGCAIYKALSRGLARRVSLIAEEAVHLKSIALHHN